MRNRLLTPLLSAQEEIDLARRVHGDDMADALAARNELVLSNLGLVGTAAGNAVRRWPGTDYDDVFSEGVIALVRVAERFDPELHPNRFSSYAVPAIRNAIRDFALEDRAVRVPSYLQRPSGLAAARANVANRPTLAANLERAVLAASDAILPFAPLATAAQPHSPGLSPLETLIQHETAARITEALGQLKPLRAYVLAHRLGLCGVRQKSLLMLGHELGVCKERIRQIEVAARTDLARVLAPAERDCA